jgi:NADH-quinone oxidoreductase subunit L
MIDRDDTGEIVRDAETGDVLITDAEGHVLQDDAGNDRTIPYSLLVVAGLGVFAGCVGKSAQFPLQTWLPDAMEGPTPVSALVHSATMVAAGVYLVGRFFPMFTQEVLLTIAYIGCITLFVAATIAVVATDIKKVLAYSTISQLGYMMLGLGVFGWGAGLFHLITHAFFKSLMFLCSGSVIHGCHHEQEMPKMGGLLKKMPITALTMLVGVIAISGLAIPGTTIAFSGFHSKDAIVATALAFIKANPGHFLLFLTPLVTAGITAFYMFRLWFYTFVGKPRDQHVHDHAHESPWIMTAPLLVLSVFAAFVAFGGESGPLYLLITGDEPAHVAPGIAAATEGALTLPGHEAVHAVHSDAGVLALIAAIVGTLLAYVLYGTEKVNVEQMKQQLAGVHSFLTEKWYFDELYDALFMKPAHKVGAFCSWFDRTIFDGILHGAAKVTIVVSKWDRLFDEVIVDGFVNLIGNATFSVGRSLRVIQTGRLRQYVMFIVVGVVVLFAVLFTTFPG